MAVALCLTAIMLRTAETRERAPARDDAHSFRRNVCSWTELKRRNVVMQERDFSCGAAALATLVKYHLGDNASEEFFLKKYQSLVSAETMRDRIENGLNMNDLEQLARGAGYETLKGTLTLEKLAESKVPLIVGISVQGYDHFVVYRGLDSEYIYLADPLRGNVRIFISEFLEQWQENGALAVVRKDRDPPPSSPLTVRRSEVFLGELNIVEVRKSLSRPATGVPIPNPR